MAGEVRRPNTRAAMTLAGAAVLLVLCLSAARPAMLDPRAVQSEVLGNGLRLIVCPDAEAQVISAEVIVKAGAADEPAGARGIAHLLDHLLWTPARPGEDDPRLRVERVGGVIGDGVLRDYTRFYVTVPSGYLEQALEALSEVVLRSRYDDSAVARERQVVLSESAERREDPRAVLNDLAFQELFGPAHPYGSPIEGSADDLNRLDATRLEVFHRTWYVPNNITVVVAGVASFEDVRELVGRLFGGLPPAPLPERPRPAPERPASSHERIVQMPVQKAYVMAAFVGPEASEHAQVCASDLLATLLVQDPIGRLAAELTERRGIASEVGADFLTQRCRSLFGIWAICQPEQVEEVKAAIRSELTLMAGEPVSGEELAAAKRLLMAGFAFANETPPDRAATLSFYEAVDTYRAASYYLSWVAYANPESVREVAGWYSGEPVWVILMPKAQAP